MPPVLVHGCVFTSCCHIIHPPSQVGSNAFATARHRVDQVAVVNEDYIALAILRLAEIEKSVVEGAGATGLAACLSGQLDHLKGKK